MTAMTPDKVEAALASLKQVSAAIACPDLPRRTRADESRWAATITEALSVLTEALAESRRDAARYRKIRCAAKSLQIYFYDDADDPCSGDWNYNPSPNLVDAFVDAAMKETP